jgi:hypothetical protein
MAQLASSEKVINGVNCREDTEFRPEAVTDQTMWHSFSEAMAMLISSIGFRTGQPSEEVLASNHHFQSRRVTPGYFSDIS